MEKRSAQQPLFWDGKRYHSLNYHLRHQFGEKVFKVPLDAGLTCPNRDGTVGTGGCVFCSARGAGDFAGDRSLDLITQFRTVRDRMHKKWPKAKYLAYFQAFTNTYAPVDTLRGMYELVLQEEGVVGLSIATRPDCLPTEVLDLLSELNERTYLWVELGLQTIHERTRREINIGSTYAGFLEAVERLAERHLRTCIHIILGLPGETEAEMLATGRAVANLPIQGVKIHLLHLMRGTHLARQYENRPFPFLDQDTYVKLVVDILEILPPAVVIHRLTGDSPRELILGPMWSLKKWEVLNAIDAELERRNTWQGRWWVKMGEHYKNS
ncbi:MAG: TIGR01212 family radical SAM protein [Firmicutes bacterium]|nr:TIGR01212 family radical SAM protein [Bacillota bacterium]